MLLFLQNDKNEKHEFHLDDCLDYIRIGMKVIVDDEVTKRFTAEELQVNVLSLTFVGRWWTQGDGELLLVITVNLKILFNLKQLIIICVYSY